jgi:hypothetical protein
VAESVADDVGAVVGRVLLLPIETGIDLITSPLRFTVSVLVLSSTVVITSSPMVKCVVTFSWPNKVAVKRHERRSGAESVETSRRSLIESARITTRVLFDRFAAAVDRGDDYTAALLNRELRGNRDQLARLQGAYMPELAEVNVNVRQTPGEIIREAQERLLTVIDAEVVGTKEIEP